MAEQHWSVTVAVNGKDILTIESNSLCGKSDLSDLDLEAIRTAGNNLLGFAGRPNITRAIDAAVNRIIANWDDWDGEAMTQAQIQQETKAGNLVMDRHLRNVIEGLLAKIYGVS